MLKFARLFGDYRERDSRIHLTLSLWHSIFPSAFIPLVTRKVVLIKRILEQFISVLPWNFSMWTNVPMLEKAKTFVIGHLYWIYLTSRWRIEVNLMLALPGIMLVEIGPLVFLYHFAPMHENSFIEEI